MTPNPPKVTRKQAEEALWRQGVLVWLLREHQKDLYNLYHKTTYKTNTWLISRRFGKSHSLALMAIETCIRRPESIVKFVAPTKSQINTILRPIMSAILKSCPADLKPTFNSKDYIYYFPNGSEIQLAGSENKHYEKLRGAAAQLCIVDEAQSVTDLDDVLKSVLLPTTLTTKGKIIISGTPPKDPSHDFVKIIEEAEAKGSLIRKTIYDNKHLTKEEMDQAEEESGGKDSEYFRREYLCQIIKDPTLSVVPEFTAKLEEEIIKEWPKPVFFDTYESMDLGFQDLTGILFAYYDFRADKVIIEDEYAVKGTDVQIPKLCEVIKRKEEELWNNPLTNEIKKPYLRVSDINYIVLNEIYRYSHKEISFLATKKDDKEAAINTLRVMLANKKIIIHPRCQTLIRHLRNVKWDSSGKKFARSADDGHYDLVDALIYMVRSIIYTKNPYPAHYDMNLRREDAFVYNKDSFEARGQGVDINQFSKLLVNKPNPQKTEKDWKEFYKTLNPFSKDKKAK